METRERSELQLLRISRGAHELTHMIDSWSKTPTRGGESAHIANKLLRGSLELQDSLQILSKLQKDSCRILSDKNMKQRVKAADAGDQIFCNKIWLQKARVTVDGCSTNSSMEVMKNVIRDRLCMQSLQPLQTDDKNVLFIKTSGSPQVKKMEVPSLIAKLMGLEEFPSGNLKRDYLETPETQIGVQRTNFDEDDEVPPVVITKSMNLVTEMTSKREKITLAELILNDRSFGHDYFPSTTSDLKRNVKPTDQIQQPQEKKVIMESKMIQGNRFVELKEVKTIAAPADTVFLRSRESDKQRKFTANVSLRTDKSLKQNKEICSPKSMAVNSDCSLNREKTSREKPVRRFKMAAKEGAPFKNIILSSSPTASSPTTTTHPKRDCLYETDAEKFEDGRLNSSTIEIHAILRGRNISLANVIPKQEKKERTIFVHKGEITNNLGIIEQDRGISRLIEQSRDIFKSQPACSQKIDIQCQSKSSVEFEAAGDQLLLDYSNDAMTTESHDGKNRLYIILENDLRCNGMIFNSSWYDGWSNGFSGEEVDQIAVQMVEQIITRVLMEVAMDLVEIV